MSFSILVITRDPNQRENVKDCIDDLLEREGQDVVVDGAGSVAEARKKIARVDAAPYDLLVSHIHIPENSRTPVNTEEKRGLLFLQELREEGLVLPMILISMDETVFRDVQCLHQVGLVVDGTETMEDDIVGLCRRYLLEDTQPQAGVSAAPPSGKLGKVDLIIKAGKGESIYTMEGIGFTFRTIPGPLQIDIDEINDLVNRSRNVGEISQWKTELQAIGKKILKELFENNMEFNENFNDLVQEVGGEENIRIRFVVEENIYPLALEALVDKKGKHLMLLSPLFRTVMVNHLNRQKDDILFVDEFAERPKVNCLIIAADTWGAVEDAKINAGNALHLERLTEIMEEAQALYDYLFVNRKEFNIGRVEIVKAAPDREFSELLQASLSQENWHIVHFAGHSYFDPVSGTGYFFYPGETGPIAKESDVFSHSLRFRNKTQFIYLSSCESSGADFVLGLARQLIPAIIGFRWEIDDDKAAEYARRFYEKLFGDNKSLPYAFLETRREMYEEDSDNRIWAAAMLIIQGC